MCSNAHTLLLLEVGAQDRKRNVRFPGGAGICVGSCSDAQGREVPEPSPPSHQLLKRGIRHPVGSGIPSTPILLQH